MEKIKRKIVADLSHILEEDATFADSPADERAMEVVDHILQRSERKIDLSPSRYGLIQQLNEKTVLSVFEKGHNFYQDPVIKEIDITRLYQ